MNIRGNYSFKLGHRLLRPGYRPMGSGLGVGLVGFGCGGFGFGLGIVFPVLCFD